MDSLRGDFSDRSGMIDSYDSGDDDVGHEAPPAAIGQDERRMQVRAYNHWASLLGKRPLPQIADLATGTLPDFDPYSVLLDFSAGIENPAIRYLGAKLAAECNITQSDIRSLADVPRGSLLSRITDHYLQIHANQAPIGFEAEFVNQSGRTILYRGILLPFSGSLESTSIDLIYGVINWKELADQATTEALLSEIDRALEVRPLREAEPLVDWADGPTDGGADILDLVDPLEDGPGYDWPEPEFGEAGDPALSLADWLASARELAQAAQGTEDRSRQALYSAIGRAWDFALAAAEYPADYAELLTDSGLTKQDRAPYTPVAKLVFGADHDKTRLTEYATAMAHARRHELGKGELAGFLARAVGGLKGVVQAERRLRREESGKSVSLRDTPREALAKRLREVEVQAFSSLASEGEEFALLVVRRTAAGEIMVLGEVAEDTALLERATRRLLG